MNEKKLYRVNPFCPECGEEHAYFTIQISEEEQKILDEYYKNHENETNISLLLSEPPLIVKRTFTCPVCRTVFTKNVGIRNIQRVGSVCPGAIPMGIYPV